MVQERVSDRLLLVGTAHVSPESVREVESAIESFQPEVVAVELDATRLDALENRSRWESTPIHKILQSDRLWLFLTQILLSGYQRRLGETYGSPPGAEMLAAVQAARQRRADVLLADRDIGITMKRAYRTMRFREKWRLTWEFTKAFAGGATEDPPPSPETLTREDVVTQMMQELGQIAPSIKSVVLDERDQYLAAKIQSVAHRRVVAVVGAGHLPGIRDRLKAGHAASDLTAIETVPKKRFSLAKFVFVWLLPASVIALFLYFAWIGYQEGNWTKLRDAAVSWTLITGGFAAVGALLARGHPASIVAAFAAAPITTLHPALAAGWFSGAVEAWVREPTARDFEALTRAKTAKDYIRNPVMRILWVAALTNLTTMAGLFFAGPRLFQILQGG